MGDQGTDRRKLEDKKGRIKLGRKAENDVKNGNRS